MIPFFGQSNYDLSLQITGSLDNFIGFCNQNGVVSINTEVSNYNGDIVNPANVGYRYATKNLNTGDTGGDYDLSDYSSEDYS